MKIVSIQYLLMLLLLLQSGCIIIPVDSYVHGSRQNIDKETKVKIIPGKTTLKDVILLLGEPDIISRIDNSLIYGIEKTEFGILLVSAAGGMGLPVSCNYSLVLNFNDHGVVTKVEYNKGKYSIAKDGWQVDKPRFYHAIPSDVPLPSDIKSVLISITDPPNVQDCYCVIMGNRGLARLDPSESEVIRRILVRKLTELQQLYGIESPQQYSVDIDEFFYCFDDTLVLFTLSFKASIKLTLRYTGKEYSLIGTHHIYAEQLTAHFGKGKDKILANVVEQALQNIVNNLESQAHEIFSITDK